MSVVRTRARTVVLVVLALAVLVLVPVLSGWCVCWWWSRWCLCTVNSGHASALMLSSFKPETIVPPSVRCAYTEQCNCSLTGQVKGHSLGRPCPLTQKG